MITPTDEDMKVARELRIQVRLCIRDEDADEFIARALASQREADCKAVCPLCAAGDALKFAGDRWVHSGQVRTGNYHNVGCKAAAIRVGKKG